MITFSFFPIDSVSHDVVEIIRGNKSVVIKITFSEDFVDFLVV
jgi:hypothetical protein